ncbi:hypothetical protein [Pleomorphomonas sp. NRK KF1]|uniref:hypothetical protein n=1 Tax=Pleomorphomonas sp. NRK KF1 TaxID=2943000 RepID=UPI0020432136|nr:hypothetical protein [Pleomorphomonas sp. NRK KF1]MCM5554158.1 hypothetical protein [Pleomorphomonas sp. NRK KF1]
MATGSIDGSLRGIARVIANPPKVRPEDSLRLPALSRSQGTEAPAVAAPATDPVNTAAEGGLHGIRAILGRSIPVVRSDDQQSKLTVIIPSAEEKAQEQQRRADEAARHAEFVARLKAIQAAANHEDHTICLPNITSLTIDTARKVRGFVEVRIENHEDVGRVVSGGYDQQQIDSLETYLSLITDYINRHDASAATSQPETTSPTTDATSEGFSAPTVSAPSTLASDTPTPPEPVVGADPNWTDPVGEPGQNHIFFPNVASLSRETAAAVYRQVSDMVKTQDTSSSVIRARNGSAGTYSVDTYMSWLAQRAAIDMEA